MGHWTAPSSKGGRGGGGRYLPSRPQPRLGARIVLSLIAATLLSTLSIITSPGYHNGFVSAAPLAKHADTATSSLKRQVPEPGNTPQQQQQQQPEEDPCGILGQLVEPEITYMHVKACYENVPYNATEANNVLSTLYTLYRDYYIFLDSAMNPNLEKPFTTPPVDILGGLDLISRQDYQGDFWFQNDVDLLVSKLNDAHANYLANCYRHYLFVQPFELYAPVAHSIQTVRILVDKSGQDLEDCHVLTIDGVNALDAIQSYVDLNSAISKDAGVRLNKALTAQVYDSENLRWDYLPGMFTTRATLPERQAMLYHVQCAPSPAYPDGRDLQLKADWDVYRLVSWNEFDSTESFLTQNCYKDTDPRSNEETQASALKQGRAGEKQRDTGEPKEKEKKKKKKRFAWDESLQVAVETPRLETLHPLSKLSKRQEAFDPVSRLIYNGTTTGFYQLLKRPTTGVVVIPTHSVKLDLETDVFVEGFDRLYKVGVRNVILDLTSNGGGYVNFAYDLVDWMFPVDNHSSVYLSDLRSSASAKALAQRDLAEVEYAGYFNPDSFSDPDTNEDMSKNFFLDDQLQRRVSRRLGYTPLVYMNHNLGAFELGMPWQHDPQRVVVMTDGFCGSACGMSLNRLKNTHGVKSYAFGGRVGEDLSLFSFPGASVYGLDAILNDFENLGVDPPMSRLRYKGTYRVPILEFFMEGDPVPIEFNPKYFKADFHVDYTPVTARHHEVLWEIVANNHWRAEGESGDHPSIEKPSAGR